MRSTKGFNIVSDEEASHIIKSSPGSFLAYLGAGASFEAGVPMAAGICQELADECVLEEERNRQFKGLSPTSLSGKDRDDFLAHYLSWDDDDNRYYNCVTRVLPSPVSRVEYFRKKLSRVKPAFAHYAATLLMTRGSLSRTAFTTNFDKLLEYAFAEIGDFECQAIRISDEVQFWRQEPDKCYLFKLHGDYDTHNVLNTEDETVTLDPKMVAKARVLLANAGLLVLGSAGREKSIHTLMDTLTAEDSQKAGVLEHGLLWGVYVGPGQPVRLNDNDLAQLVEERIDSGAVGPDIRRLMRRRANYGPNFAFFPIWGCGSFLWSLIRHTLQDPSAGEEFLDHEQRIGEVFRRKGLSEAARHRHIQALRTAQQKVASSSNPSSSHAYVLEAKTTDNTTRVWLAYGDVSNDGFLNDSKVFGRVKAIVSPEDTCLSIGGGAALAIANKAGLRRVLHDLYKFAPIDQGSTAVTSAGRLGVQYLVHAASVDVTENGASTTPPLVKETAANILRRIATLGVDVVWIPLMGAGVAGMTAQQSAEAIADAINEWLPLGHPCTVVMTVFNERLLPRNDMETILQARLTRKSVTIGPL